MCRVVPLRVGFLRVGFLRVGFRVGFFSRLGVAAALVAGALSVFIASPLFSVVPGVVVRPQPFRDNVVVRDVAATRRLSLRRHRSQGGRRSAALERPRARAVEVSGQFEDANEARWFEMEDRDNG